VTLLAAAAELAAAEIVRDAHNRDASPGTVYTVEPIGGEPDRTRTALDLTRARELLDHRASMRACLNAAVTALEEAECAYTVLAAGHDHETTDSSPWPTLLDDVCRILVTARDSLPPAP
jgi:hypothetical protein